MSTRNDIFEAYGDEPRAALDAWLNVDPEGFARWSDQAEERQYHAEFMRWVRGKTIKLERVEQNPGQTRLFEPPATSRGVKVRAALIHGGEIMETEQLAGLEGARFIRAAMTRDLAPAKTTVARCAYGFALADHLEAETERLGRPVSVAEVVGLRLAS